MRPKLSIVIPAYNEEARLARTLPVVAAYGGRRGDLYEIVVVDDGSRDGTARLTRRLAEEYPCIRLLRHAANLGKGQAVRSGVLDARGDYIFFSDADLSTPIEDIDHLLPWLEGDYDIAIGSRSVPGSRVLVHQPLYREKMGRVFNNLVRLLAVKDIQDTQCGFKSFRKEAAHTVFRRQTLSGFCFDVEILHIAVKLGYRIKEQPVTWSNSADTRVSPLTDAMRMFYDLFRIRLRHRRLGPAAAARPAARQNDDCLPN